MKSVPAYWLYGERRDERFPDALHIETIAARSSMHDWSIQAHRHRDMFQFLLIASGGGRARIDGQDHGLAPGTVILVPPLVIHEFWFDTGTNGFVASAAEASLKRLFEMEPSLRTTLARPMLARLATDHPELQELEGAMAAAHLEFGQNRASRELALGAHAGVIAIWFSRCAGREISLAEPSSDMRVVLVRRFIERVESEFRSHRPLAAYATELCVSAPHLTRSCREMLGYSAMRIIHDRLMLEARRELVYTAMPISQIAFSLGFADPAYFSRFFAARTGMSPSDYRAAG
jgi:AraC family transcriptional activator of pobA